MSIIAKMFGDANARFLKSFEPLILRINELEKEFEVLSDEALREKTFEFKKRLIEGETLDELLPETFAAVREASTRTLKQRHFDVQLLGGVILHQGRIAEMKTGEGKTLVATLPAYLNALTGKGVNIVTTNDYLSRRDAVWMGQIYHALGLSVGCLNHEVSYRYDPLHRREEQENKLDTLRDTEGSFRVVQEFLRPVSRREAYEADITYGTNNEYGFDYLRDNMAYSADQMVQREHHFAIVDEVDSILIDEARTPLIISAPDEESEEYYKTFARVVPQLKENTDYNIDEKMKAVTLTEEGIEKVEKILGVKNIYEEKGFRYVRYLEQALKAEALFQKDRDYVVRNNEVVIVDEFTGRLMPGRRWSEGLHQAVEAKEAVTVQKESRTLAMITFQNYFRMYEKLAGMTGTAVTNAEEFEKVYKLDVAIIPTNKPLRREDKSDLIFRTENGKFSAVVAEIKERYEKGQPVLVGTVSIEKNERLSAMLNREGIKHEVLNAKNQEQDAMIIAQAGKFGAVTVATNVAGRGVDIILGGNPSVADEANKVRDIGGVYVLGTERHEARRIDNQLRGRAGRQGDPGETQFFVSLEDDLMRIFGSDKIKNMMASFGIAEDQPIETKLVSKAIESAQAKIEGFNFDIRKHVLEFDDVMNKQREVVYRLRREVLQSAVGNQPSTTRLRERIMEIVKEQIGKIVKFHTAGNRSDWNLEEMFEEMKALSGIGDDARKTLEEITVHESDDKIAREEIINFLFGAASAIYNVRESAIGEQAMRNLEKVVLLQSIDALWMDHLDSMEHLRQSVRLRAYGQRDPLVEYKNEGSRMFRQLQDAIESQVANTIFKVGLAQQSAGGFQQPAQASNLIFKSSEDQSVNNFAVSAGIARQQKSPELKVGRNDPCPCGSGKKYKRCHGA